MENASNVETSPMNGNVADTRLIPSMSIHTSSRWVLLGCKPKDPSESLEDRVLLADHEER